MRREVATAILRNVACCVCCQFVGWGLCVCVRARMAIHQTKAPSAPMHSYFYYRRDFVAGSLGIRAAMGFCASLPGRSVKCFVKRDRNRGSAPARMAQGNDPAATP
ncbi:hypothetical protein B0T21DRAFT_368182 [Apiosordaria backusii]|uniref:Uncharacterized protein n=1 Tax=Apiosordaria backusii TaxID=314023 RepID=A0AA40ED60_9PEZI|nr:hypothetical protein B0T21DRAFT_368182 [Apiosordaria backusii]